MDIEIRPSRAEGMVKAPPSKSAAHRLLLCAGLAAGRSTVRNVAFSEDILATLDVLRALGAEVQIDGDTVTLQGANPFEASTDTLVSCRESGSTLRFCIPLFLLSGRPCTLTGKGRLMQRPQSVYESICEKQGLTFEASGNGIRLRGPLQAGTFAVQGNISSQFITGLLFALPLLDRDSRIELIPPVESRSYLNITVEALKTFGIAVEWQDENTLSVPGGQQYQPKDVTVEGDWSNAAFFSALEALGDPVEITGLGESQQGDRIYQDYFPLLKAGKPTLDVTDCPDLAPILMALSAALNGCVLTGTRRLKIKESDRGAAMEQELSKLGVRCLLDEDRIEVFPGIHRPTEPIDGHNDHRIVMAMSVLLTRVGGVIRGAEAVAKSFPDYFEQFENLKIEVKKHAARQ